MSHESWLVDSSMHACTVGSFMIERPVYLSLPRWMHTERRAEYIPTNPGSRIFQSHLPLSYFLSYSGGRGGADLQRACVRRRGSNRACGCVELQRACGGADLTMRAAARNCSVRPRGSNRACGGADLTVRRRGSKSAGEDLRVPVRI
jgi:hypothetical protein